MLCAAYDCPGFSLQAHTRVLPRPNTSHSKKNKRLVARRCPKYLRVAVENALNGVIVIMKTHFSSILSNKLTQ